MSMFLRTNKTKYLLGAISLFLVLAASFALTRAESKITETRAKDIEFQNFNPSQEESGLTAEVAELKANYFKHQNYEWQSKIIKADFSFDGLGASWHKDEASKINIFIRFSKNNKDWEDWQEMIVDDADQGNEKSASAQNSSLEISDLVFSKEARYFQYKVVFADKKEEANLSSIKFTYIKAGEEKKGTPKAQAVNSPHVISRDEWGANPGYMTWPPEYVRPNKIIIHHTASGNNPPDPAAVVRSIYYYHAVSLGWGDIGYNYLFDQYGNIYEGRAGGNMAVGAHAYGQNYGSVGFSAIGDFSGVDLTSSTLTSLIDMTAYKAYENDFDITFNTVFGHRDFCNNPAGHNCTACPGNVLYSRKGQIIDLARQSIGAYLQRDIDFLNQNNNVLVKSYSSPVVYLWLDGQKRPIVDATAFIMLGYSWSSINSLSSLALNDKPLGTKISALIKAAGDPRVYLIGKNPDIKYYIPDGTTFNEFGFNWDNIVEENPDGINAIPSGGDLVRAIKSPDSPNIYYIYQGKKYLFANMPALEGWGFGNNFTIIRSAFLNLLAPGNTLYNLVWADGWNIYLLQRGIKYKVPDMATFNFWQFKFNELSAITADQLSSFSSGPEVSRIVKGDGLTIYLLDQGKKYPFPDPEVLSRWGKTPEAAFPATDSLLAGLATAEPVSDLIKSADSPIVYLVYGGIKYPIANELSFLSWGKNWNEIRTYSNDTLASLPTGPMLKNFVQKISDPEDPNVYLVISGQKRLILDSLTLNLWGGADNFSRIPVGLFDSIEEASAVGYLIKGSEPTIYLIDKGKKNALNSLEAFNAWGFSINNVSPLPDQVISGIPNGNSIGYLIKADEAPAVYKIEGGKKAAFPSPEVFFSWGYNFEAVKAVSPSLIALLGDDPTLTVFAKSSVSDPTVYLLNRENKKQFIDLKVLEAYGGDNKIVVSGYINNLPTLGNANILIKGPASTIYYLVGGAKLNLPDWDHFVHFGFALDQVTLVNQLILNLLPDGPPFSRLIKGSGPDIYYMENGQRRHIPNMETFNSWGWDINTIRTLDDYFLNQFPLGPDVPFNAPSLYITANGSYTIINSFGETLRTANGGDRYYAYYYNGSSYLMDNGRALLWSGSASLKFVPDSANTIMEIMSYSDPNWNGSTNYNRFRGTIEVTHSGSGTWAVNELSLNDYTAGICEAPGGHPEYLKTMAVAARSYGLWHLSRGGKHAGEPFHLMNSRRGNGNDQVYCGYGYEAIASSYAPQARATDNQVVLYNWNPILAAYSHGSYPRTRSAREVWGTDYPYLQSVDDPYGDQNRPCGTGGNHCVGLSASGAIGFAERGSSYVDILRHYYTGAGVAPVPSQNIRIAIYSF